MPATVANLGRLTIFSIYQITSIKITHQQIRKHDYFPFFLSLRKPYCSLNSSNISLALCHYSRTYIAYPRTRVHTNSRTWHAHIHTHTRAYTARTYTHTHRPIYTPCVYVLIKAYIYKNANAQHANTSNLFS